MPFFLKVNEMCHIDMNGWRKLSVLSGQKEEKIWKSKEELSLLWWTDGKEHEWRQRGITEQGTRVEFIKQSVQEEKENKEKREWDFGGFVSDA